MLLDEIEAGRIRTSEIDVSRSMRLTKHGDKEIRTRAAKLFASAAPADRKNVLEQYGKALSLSADANRGREVFRKNCTSCHRIGDLGVNVAPDIADSRTRTPASLLTDILDPNRAIDNNYFSYTVVTLDGKVHTGIIAAETASSITLRQQENKTLSLLRQDIEEMRSNGVSLMPVGLEKEITVEQMADLISFIKNWRYLDGRVPIKVN
jgi:putative heme-binding domain-containing protein